MNHAVHFSTGKDDWATPYAIFFHWRETYFLSVDAAADTENHLLPRWYGPGGEREDALAAPWDPSERYWLNPPYSRILQTLFVAQAVEVATRGGLVVALLPARTDTNLFHTHIWDRATQQPRPWVSAVHFLRGRIKFVGAPASAPFPSMIVVFGARSRA